METPKRLTDPEIRFKRALEKMPVPEWYSNRTPKPITILQHTPIDTQLSPWKTRYNSPETNVVSPTFSVKKVIEQFERTSNHNVDLRRSSKQPRDQSPVKDTTLDIDKTPKKRMSRARRLTRFINQSFPKLSPSRKIKNINIPITPVQKKSNRYHDGTFKISKVSSDSGEMSYVKTPKKLFSRLTNLTKSQRDSSNRKTPVKCKVDTPFRKQCESSKFKNDSATKNSTQNFSQYGDNYKENVASPVDNTYVVQNPRFKARRTLIPIDENIEMYRDDVKHQHVSSYTTQSNNPQSSSKLIKKNKPSSVGLVDEIIKEFQQKCDTASDPVYASQGSRNFVEKLVQVLEKNVHGRRKALQKNLRTNLSREDIYAGSICSAAQSSCLNGISNKSYLTPESDFINWSDQVSADVETSKYNTLFQNGSFIDENGVVCRASSLRSDVSLSSNVFKSPDVSPIEWNDDEQYYSDEIYNFEVPRKNYINHQLQSLYCNEKEKGTRDSGYSDGGRSVKSTSMLMSHF